MLIGRAAAGGSSPGGLAESTFFVQTARGRVMCLAYKFFTWRVGGPSLRTARRGGGTGGRRRDD